LGSFVFSSMSATIVAQGNEARLQIKQANYNHTKHREQPDKIKLPERTHALGQPPCIDYRMRNSPAVLSWAALFFFHFSNFRRPNKVMKRIRKSN
jgi:hypothetical protein